MTFLSQFTPYSFPLLGLVRLPVILISDEDKKSVGLKSDATNVAFLKQIVWRRKEELRAAGKLNDISETALIGRLKFEVSVLEKTGTIDYILLFWDLIRWCNRNGIPVGPGRGSVCGSVICFFLGITKINSLRYSLNFTRFLSEARVKPKVIDGVVYADGRAMCDIDVDFSIARRHEVKAYIDSKYPGRTAKISNITALSGKTALKDVLKTYLEWNEDDAKRVSDMVEVHFGKADKLEDVPEKSKEYQAWVAEKSEHKDAHERAVALQGLVTHKGVHASGLFLSYAPLDETLPVEVSTDDEGEEHLTTSYDMDTVAEIGVKADVLSLKTLDVIEEACRLAGINVEDIDVDHPSVYDFLGKSRLYYGCFQIETGLAGDATFKAKPRDLLQLAACLSIARPGSLKFIPDLVEYYKSGEFKKIYPPIDAILKDTANIIIYQESINEICQQVYGMDAVSADEVRRAISKKKREDIKKWEPILFAQGDSKGIPKEVTQHFWDTCNASADYLFSKNHAVPYSVLTAQTIYLKANFRKEFYLATLKYAKKEEISLIIAEARQMGVNVLPPHLGKSDNDFKFEGNDIRFGLQHIKGIAAANLAKVSSFRRDFKNKIDVFEFAKELGLQINVMESLFWCGALSVDDTPRIKLAMEARGFNLMNQTQQNVIAKFAGDYGYDIMETIRKVKDLTNEKGKPMLVPTQLDTFRKKFSPYWNTYNQNQKFVDLFLYLVERNLLGFSYSNTLFNLFARKTKGLIPVDEVVKEPKGVEVSFVAFVDEVKSAVGRESKKPYVRFELSEESGKVRAMISGQNRIDAYIQAYEELPAIGTIVIVHGTTSGDGMVFVNELIPQDMPINIKLKKLEIEEPAKS